MAKEKSAVLVDDENSAPEKKVTKDELTVLKEQIETATKEAERERFRAETAEREREEVSRRLTQESTQRVKAEGNSIDSMIAARTATAERLKREAKQAHDEGKIDEYADLLSEYTNARQEVKGYEDQRTKLAEQETHRAEAVKSEPQYSPRTKQWIDRNPEFKVDPKFQKKAIAAHHLAEAEGYTPDSDAYFEYIESIVRPKEEEREEPVKRTSIPPSRASSGTSAPKQIKLSPLEVEFALISSPHMSAADAQNEYYKNKLALIEDGKLGRD